MGEHNPTSLSEGAVFHGRYQIVRCLKAGGMGAIYECVHITTRKHRALKVMLPQIIASPGMRDRFELEARATAEIESDHIVETFDAGVEETTGMPFLVMELLRGDDLDCILKRSGPFEAAETVTLLSQVALALDRTHAAGIVHRDLKPQNLFLTTRDDGSPRVKLLDFGIAKVVTDGKKTAQQTAAIGTPMYMAPEQATGDGTIGPPADLYALAHITYTLLTGEAYWVEEYRNLPILDFLTKIFAGQGEPPSERAARRGVTLPIAFDAWFTRATALSPADRFDRAVTQIAELAMALGVADPRISPGTVPSPLAIGMQQVLITARLQPRADSLTKGAPQVLTQPLAQGSSGGNTSALLSTTIPMTPVKRSTKPFVVSALLLLVAGIGVTVVFKSRLGGEQAGGPPMSGVPPQSPPLSAEAPAPAVSAAPVGPASVGPSAAAPAAPSAPATLKTTVIATTRSTTVRVTPPATTKVTVDRTDPTLKRR